MASLIRDIRYAIRTLMRTPGYAIVAILTLMLGIGATTAIYSVADAVLLSELPVRAPDRLAMIYTTCRRGNPRCSSSYPDFLDYRERSTHFHDMAAYSWLPVALGSDSAAARLATAQIVTGNYFELLGVNAAAGRLIQLEDDSRGGFQAVVVLSHSLWTDHFGSDETLVGQMLRLNGTAYTIIGVADEGFRGTSLGQEAELWIPMFAASQLNVGSVARADIWDQRSDRWIAAVVGRLRSGATIDQAREELLAISEQMREEHPRLRGPRHVTVDAASRYTLPVENEESITQFVNLLLGVVGLTLLLTCANLANLMLARGATRMRETGVRLCLGAGPARLIRQFLTDSLILALVGGLGGLLVAKGLLTALSGFELPGAVAIGELSIGIDWSLFSFAMLISLASGLLFGLAPALSAGRLDLVSSVKGGSQGSSSRAGFRRGLVAVQVALCLILMVGSALFLQTLQKGLTFDLGFRSENLVLARFNLSLLRYSPERARMLVDRLKDRVGRFPGVESVSLATRVPLQNGGASGTFLQVSGFEPTSREELRAEYVYVEPDYFRTLGLPLSEGRPINEGDREGATRVAVINGTMADRFWPEGAIGKRFSFRGDETEVVGVSRNTSWFSLEDDSSNYVFAALAQEHEVAAVRYLTLMARTDGDPSEIFNFVRQEFSAADRELAIRRLHTMEAQLAAVLMPQRMGAFLLSGFALLALVLASVGVFGVVSFNVNRSSRDLGIRIALGARRSEVLRLVMRSMLGPLVAGIALGLVAAFTAAQTVEAFLFRLDSRDPLTLVAMTLLLVVITGVASFLPAQKATRIDPMRVLKTD